MDFDSAKRVKIEKFKLKDKSTRIWIAKSGSNIIGYATAKKYKRLNYLGSMYILPEYQGLGLGKRLMVKTLKWFGGQKNIRLGVASYNIKAIKFYEKYGFKITKFNAKAPLLPNGQMMPGLEMTKTFK